MTTTVELHVQLPTSPVKVFRALTRTEHLRRWFVDTLDYDRSLLTFGAGRQLMFIADTGLVGQGEVTTYRPPTALEYTWDTEVLRFDLVASGTEDAETTELTFTNTIGGPDAGATADAARPGWQTALDRLNDLLTEGLA
ncbi:MAG: SRPBCC domain-containing protein [Mycobacteriaceae bacterium]|uniref:SRPBCC domain-containing protein n=1 Tax=Corynebacterium sp. TaxID=1720 RepID=UPI003F9A9661